MSGIAMHSTSGGSLFLPVLDKESNQMVGDRNGIQPQKFSSMQIQTIVKITFDIVNDPECAQPYLNVLVKKKYIK